MSAPTATPTNSATTSGVRTGAQRRGEVEELVDQQADDADADECDRHRQAAGARDRPLWTRRSSSGTSIAPSRGAKRIASGVSRKLTRAATPERGEDDR